MLTDGPLCAVWGQAHPQEFLEVWPGDAAERPQIPPTSPLNASNLPPVKIAMGKILDVHH